MSIIGDKMAHKEEKSIYIFGAGASVAAGLPSQAKLLSYIFTYENPKKIHMTNFMNTFDKFSVMLINQFSVFEKSRRVLSQFIINNFGNQTLQNFFNTLFPSFNCDTISNYIDIDQEINNKWKEIYIKIKDIDVSLEDLFTLLDKASILKEYFGIYSVQELSNIHEKLDYCIVYSISYSMQVVKNNLLYEQLSDFFVRKRLATKLSADPYSIITLNWDTLLDGYIYQACKKNNLIHTRKKILPDYCYYNYDINSETPSTHIKAKGIYNIKLMKLHGSTNWLICSNCGRVYSDFLHNITLQCTDGINKPIKCKLCDSINRKYDLKHILITPTFLKSLNTLQLKNIWHNAFMDLSEATNIYFIGYSFPDADFELRYVLKKALKQDAKIKVILHYLDNPDEYNKYFNIEYFQKNYINVEDRLNLPYKRYKTFFNNHDIEFYYGGIEKAFKEKFIN